MEIKGLEDRKILTREDLKPKKKFKIKKILIPILLVFIIVFGIRFRNTLVEMKYPKYSDPYKVVSDLDTLTPDTKKLALEFLRRCEEEGLNVRVLETYRSQERQELLYSQGRSEKGNIITWTKNSVHTKRRAFDIVKAGDAPYGDESFFEKAAKIGKEVGLECGHYWRVRDSGHFQNFKWYNKFWY